ncbi:MAG: 23S rRNA (uracil(1939)-C(5))-methyltransferase RlmD [Gammaproteobacteria bacterium]|nr:MAG: 23S rRNA (uracil(1939)-C(5))-methyltransferase RlmD [Gammaproteobacteria bacterium]
MSRRRRKKLPADPIEFHIQSLSHEGRGIADMEGKIVFVQGALAGERVSAKLTKSVSRFAEANTVEVFDASEDRVEPPCPHANICGGCSLQHMDAGKQIELKQNALLEQYQHFGGIDSVPMRKPMLGPTLGYRRKARLAAKYVNKKECVLVGFREKGNSFVADINQCAVLDPRVGLLITPLRELIAELSIRSAIPQIEVAAGDDEVILIFRVLETPNEQDLSKLDQFGETHSVRIYTQSGGPKTVVAINDKHHVERLYYSLPAHDCKFGFLPLDFTQVNAHINEQMVDLALQLLDLNSQDRVLDLFCGLGNFTLPMARQCKQVVGVEGSEEMVKRGSENALLNGISNTEFFAADLSKDIAGQPWFDGTYDKVLIDPPRSGAQAIIGPIAELGAQRIVYVSCNPATLARDAGELVKKGYRLIETGVMDMFPNTGHVESIALFEKI